MLNDLHQGFRLLGRHPGFTAVACLSLALGVGVNTTVFSVLDAALLKPLPYRDADRLVVAVSRIRHPNGDETGFVGVGGRRVAELRAIASVFESVDAYGAARPMVLADGSEEALRIGSFTPTFPAFLGIRPQVGRLFAPEDVAGGTALVISDHYWTGRFNRDPNAIGTPLPLAERARVIVGVMPPEFRYFAGLETDGWLPLDDRSGGYLVARLRPGLAIEGAQRELDAIVADGIAVTPEPWEAGQQWRLELQRGDWDRWETSSRSMLIGLLGAAGLLLLLASANVGNLLLVRAIDRRREIAVRRALGATRLQLVRQFVIEGAVLGAVGGLAALTLAWWGVAIIPSLVPAQLTFSLVGAHLPHVDGRVLAFAGLAVIVTILFCGVAPAINASRPLAVDGQRAGGRSRGQRRLLDGFQAVQVAITLVLLLGAGLLAASLFRMIAAPSGFVPERLAHVSITLPQKPYAVAARRFAFFEELLTRIRALPAVESAALGPSPNSSLSGRFTVEGRMMDESENRSMDVFYVGPDYFDVAGIQIKSGRAFGPRDGPSSALVAVISESAAARFWPGREAIGQRFRTGPSGPVATIVGIAAGVKTIHFTSEAVQAYFPLGQRATTPNALIVRLTGEPTAFFSAVRELTRAIDPAARVNRARMVRTILDEANPMGPPRFYALLLGVFAGLALVTAAVGLYGVISFAVGRRTHEIGVRMALGANAAAVRRLVTLDALAPVLTGTALGLAGSVWFSRLLESQLYRVQPHDPATFLAVVAVLLFVCAAAALGPARRATRIDPTAALRID